ncbi:MAG: hypothetical protein Q9160_003273 [Pyrenula sp. 1 TL-2023]
MSSGNRQTRPLKPQPQATQQRNKSGPKRKEKTPTIPREPASSSQRTTRSSLRSGAATTTSQEVDDPESFLRKPRKRVIKAVIPPNQSPENEIPDLAELVRQRLEAQARRRTKQYYQPQTSPSDDHSWSSAESQHPEQAFNEYWGYLPPLDEECAALVRVIVENPHMAPRVERLGAERDEFRAGLRYRNVSLTPETSIDSRSEEIKQLATVLPNFESKEEKASYERLWALDQRKLEIGSNEALFQRTLMMDIIGRHYLIYRAIRTKDTCLDFSVEEPWTCPPMPTRAYGRPQEKFLTQPKPDLSVCFLREAIIPEDLWLRMPRSMSRLACYENDTGKGDSRVFHFLTIEGKKLATSTKDEVAMRQSLNNASQGLHNLFEFCRDAGYEQEFYDSVRFFSVVATTEGILIRIHRAVKELNPDKWIMPKVPEYPLRFEYRTFMEIRQLDDRDKILKTFRKILIGYGVDRLYPLLQQVAKSMSEKFPPGSKEIEERADHDFYRYGQIGIGTASQKGTGRTSLVRSVRNGGSLSEEMPPPERPPQAIRDRSESVQSSRTSPSPAAATEIPSSSPPSTGKKRTVESAATVTAQPKAPRRRKTRR